MNSDDLFYPSIKAKIGNYTFTKGIYIESHSSKNSYFDWAKIKFTSQFKDKISLSVKDTANIQLGYNDVYYDVFEGYVSKPYDNGDSINEILFKDPMLLLEETIINNTFIDTTPQELIKYSLSKAGISKINLLSDTLPSKARVPVAKKNVVSVLNEINALWMISKKFFFTDGTFYWGTVPEQSKIYSFEYGSNIISLTRQSAMWELETVLTPFIKHSHKIKVKHPQITGEYEVKKISYLTNDAGFIRTYIYF